MQPRILLPLATVALAFVAPAAANAAVTPTVQGSNLTLTGDNTAENITLTANAAGLLTHSFGTGANGLKDATDFDPNPLVEKTLPNDGSVKVTVNAGDGNDTINLSAPDLGDSVINGDAGDDIIVGSDNLDTIDGGAGNDRITGFKNPGGATAPFEPISGGAGNDVMIWNNGDGFDLNDGGDGVDETLITNGTGNDDMNVNQNGARTIFNRVNAPFSVDIGTVEKLTITSFSGDDKLVTAAGVPLPMTIDAGAGDDTISTGDGADVINGGDGTDTL